MFQVELYFGGLGHRKSIPSAPTVWSVIYLKNEVLHDMGALKDLDLAAYPQQNYSVVIGVGRWGVETPITLYV